MKRQHVQVVMIVLLLGGLLQVIMSKEAAPEEYIVVNNERIAYTTYGSGEKTMLLIHGSPGSKDDFRLLGPALKSRKIYAIDMPGFGESTKNVNDVGAQAAAKWLVSIMDILNISKTEILGYSWGGAVAMVFAEKYPERTEKIFLLASMGLIEGEATGSVLGEQLRYYLAYPFVLYYPGSFVWNYGARRGFMQSFMDTDQTQLEKTMKKIRVPTIIVHGKEDTVVPTWLAEKHQETIPQSKLMWYEGGHGTIFRNGKIIAQVVHEVDMHE